MEHTRDSIREFLDNSCWKDMKSLLIDKKEEYYQRALIDDADEKEVVRNINRLALIEEILEKEKEFIKQIGENNG